MKNKLIKNISTDQLQDWEKAASQLTDNAKGNLSEFIRRAANYCAKKKIKL
jgi:hypothetical protein